MNPSENPQVTDVDALAEKAKEWVTSKEGQESLLKALRNARDFTRELQKARAVDPKRLDDPVTL